MKGYVPPHSQHTHNGTVDIVAPVSNYHQVFVCVCEWVPAQELPKSTMKFVEYWDFARAIVKNYQHLTLERISPSLYSAFDNKLSRPCL